MGYYSTYSVQTQSFTIIGYRNKRKQQSENIAIATTNSVQSQCSTIFEYRIENITIAAT